MPHPFGSAGSGYSADALHRHAVVLAGGDGRRLAEVTERLYGYARPKQFCRLGSERTLLDETIERALWFTGVGERIWVSTSRTHRTEAAECLAGRPEVQRIEQPRNLDTTPGILLPVMRILARDPDATVLILPSDHHISDDQRFINALTGVLDALEAHPNTLLLAGARLVQPEPDLGWIVPGVPVGRWRSVEAFVEKPSDASAEQLHARGALANTFALVARAEAIAELARRYVPDWWEGLRDVRDDPLELEQLYRQIEPSSFSRDVLSKATGSLGVVPLYGVEWSDIGTPERLSAVRGTSRPGDQVSMSAK